MEDIQKYVASLSQHVAGAEGAEVTVPVKILTEGLDHIKGLKERLSEAQESYKPSVAKRLNEKITKLEREIAELRNRNKVNELEKKVQRLESELKASYATKNFTIKNGMLEIEKQYRITIESSMESQQLWHDIMNLLGDEVRDLPVSYLARQEASIRKNSARAIRAEASVQAAAVSSAPSNAAATSENEVSQQGAQTYVQQTAQSLAEQLRKITEHALPDVPKAQEPGSVAKLVDIRDGRQSVGEVVETSTSMAQAREFFKDGSAPLPTAHADSPTIRQASLTPDARASDRVIDSVDASLANLRQLFQGGAPPSGPASSAKDTKAPQLVADATFFDQQMDALEADVQRLRGLYKGAAPAGAAAGVAAAGARLHGAGLTADASHFEKQMDAALASISELRGMYSRASAVPAGAGVAAGSTGGKKGLVPDASALQQKLEVLQGDLAGLRQVFSNGDDQAAAASTADRGGHRSGAQAAGDVDDLVGLFTQFMGGVVVAGTQLQGKAAAGDGSAQQSMPPLDQLSSMFRDWLEKQNGQLPAAGQLLLVATAAPAPSASSVAALELSSVGVGPGGGAVATDASSSTEAPDAHDKGIVTDISLPESGEAPAALRASSSGLDASTATEITFAPEQDTAALASGRASLSGTDVSTGTEISLAPGDTSLLGGRPVPPATDVAVGTEISITTDSVPGLATAVPAEARVAAVATEPTTTTTPAAAAADVEAALAEVGPASPMLGALDASEVLEAGKAGDEAGATGSAMMGMGAVQRGVEVLEQRHTRLLQASPGGARLMRDVTTLLAAFVDAHNNSVTTLQQQQQQRQLTRTTSSRRRQSTSALPSTYELDDAEAAALGASLLVGAQQQEAEPPVAGSDKPAGPDSTDEGEVGAAQAASSVPPPSTSTPPGAGDAGDGAGIVPAVQVSVPSALAATAPAASGAAVDAAAATGGSSEAPPQPAAAGAVSSAAEEPAAGAVSSAAEEPAAGAVSSAMEEPAAGPVAAAPAAAEARKEEGQGAAEVDAMGRGAVAAAEQVADSDDEAVGSVCSADLMAELEEARAKVEHYEVLVRKLNDQMRRAMEKMDDQGDTIAMRAARTEEVDRRNGELEGENQYLTSQLITTKVELATSKGEYMTLYKALKKALNRENDAMQQLEELERVIQVVAPSESTGGSILPPGNSRLPVETADSDYFGRGFFANVLRSSSSNASALHRDGTLPSTPTGRQQPSTPTGRQQPPTPTRRQQSKDLPTP